MQLGQVLFQVNRRCAKGLGRRDGDGVAADLSRQSGGQGGRNGAVRQHPNFVCQAALVGLAGRVPFQGQGLACEAGKGIVLRHVGHDLVVGGQGRSRFSNGVTVACVSVQHILFIKIPCIIFGRRHLRGILISRRLVIADETAFVPSSGDDFPNDRLCRRIGVVHRGDPQLLGRPGGEAVHGYQLQQIPLGLVELVLPVRAIH